MTEGIWMRDYTYELPEERIASVPLDQRDSAKLLTFRNGDVGHSTFSQLPDLLDTNSTLYFNDTRVIPARLLFRKETGAAIEVLLMTPVDPSLAHISMSAKGRCSWRCIIGNLKRWTGGLALQIGSGSSLLHADLIDKANNIIEFTWTPRDLTFAEILQQVGDIPLPPYIHRSTTVEDKVRYQTVYAHHDGAVAAPTAGLHFTTAVTEGLKRKGINSDFITLHASAGTFLPVKAENAVEHRMHEEQVIVSRQNIINLLSGRKVVAVGTTTLRTLESLYWFGCKLDNDPSAPFDIQQEEPYSGEVKAIDTQRSLQNVLARLGTDESIYGKTSIFIRPGYTFHVCDSLITNFHQPGSTLLLLVAAFAGQSWKTIYREALTHGYRFLSYGDSSLIHRS